MNIQKCYLSMHRYKAFLKVAEVGSFTKAAELLGYTQPALSQMMTSLERELSIDPPIIRTLAVVTKDRRTLPLAAKVFIDELVASRGQLL